MSDAIPSFPTGEHERLSVLDTLRGFALLGILFVNMTWFTGFAVSSAEDRARLGTEAADAIVNWLIHFAVEGKFWSIFALLFGVCAAIQFQRTEALGRAFAPVWLRRMTILLPIGLMHGIFIWFGDIVSLYAVVGMALLPFRRCTDRGLICWALFFGVFVPVLVGGIWLAADQALRNSAESSVDPGHGPYELLIVFRTGSYSEVFGANWAFLKVRWLLAIYTSRLFALLAMFLIGFLAGRMGISHEPNRHRHLLRRILFWGLLMGLPANAVLAYLVSEVSVRPPSGLGWLMASVQAVGVPALCLAYVAGLTLLYQRPAWRKWMLMLAHTGRASLTNYALQSVVCVVIFYGYGFGYWGCIGTTWSVPLILSIFACQTIMSAWWLRHFRYGPMEWVWRSLTYKAWLPIVRGRRVAAVALTNQSPSLTTPPAPSRAAPARPP